MMRGRLFIAVKSLNRVEDQADYAAILKPDV